MEEVLNTVNPYLALTAILVNAVFVVLVLLRTSRSNVYITFLCICISVVLWNFGQYMTIVSDESFWHHIALVGSAFIPSFAFHFIVTLLRPARRKTAWILMAYAFSSLLALSAFLAVFNSKTGRIVDIAWDIFYLVLVTPFFLVGIIMLFAAVGLSASEDERSRLRYFLFAGVIGLATAVTDHVQTLGVQVPPLGHLGSVFFSSILAVGVFQHRTAYDILAQARVKLRVLSEMSAGIAHEVRNPLSSIRGAAKLLSSRPWAIDAAGGREYLDLIVEEVDRLDKMLLNFQFFTRPVKMDMAHVSIDEVVRKTVRLAEFDTLDMTIKLELSGGSRKVYADAALLKQVFFNVIRNAAEAAGPGGELVIVIGFRPPWVEISFSDNGSGITQEAESRVFEPFFTTKSGGMGMGLAICRKIIQEHQGEMEVRNVPSGGAKVIIVLPAFE